MSQPADREKIWEPSAERAEASQLRGFQRWLADSRGVRTDDYASVHAWSIEHVDDFWEALWEHFQVIGERGDGPVRTGETIEDTRWFPGARLNYAQNMLRWAQQRPDDEAIVAYHETAPRTSVTWSQLAGQVGALAQHLRQIGVRPGDTVCAVLPNTPQTMVALLATAAVGAVWSVVNTDFGPQGIQDRFEQIRPRVLLSTDRIEFGGKQRDLLASLPQILETLPTVEHHVLVDTAEDPLDMPEIGVPSRRLSKILEQPQEPEFELVEFSHPLWILYSSGTTGRPKGIVHSHGGMVLESIKANALQYDVRPGERGYFAVSTTWMVWNMLVGLLMRGVTAVTYDGSPAHDGGAVHFEMAARERTEFFGTGAALLTMVQKSGLSPRERFDLSSLRSVLSTGSPLPRDTWRWIHREIRDDVHVGSDSGGTDVCSGILGSNPLDPEYVGELQAPYLGVDARAVDPEGRPLHGEVGELVIAQPLPCMPVSFWDDPDGAKRRDAYFAAFPGVWRQGDWATDVPDGGWEIHGRSDATINRGGIRMGSADITFVVNSVPGVQESMVIGAELPDGGYWMPLYVVPQEGTDVNDALREAITQAIRTRLSPRYVPDAIIAAPAVPLTRTGKLMEIPIKKVLQGGDPREVNRTAAADPEALEWYVEQAAQFAARSRPSSSDRQ